MSNTAPKATIRPLTLDDRRRHDELVYDLDRAHHAALPGLIRAPGDAVVAEDEYRRRIADSATFIAGAETQRGLIGFIRVSVIDSPGGRAHLPIRYARVEEIVVESNERRGGIGRALLSAARDWAQKNGARSLDLGVYAFNAEAVAFYEREGFSTKVVSLSLPLK
jgi:diamine N-acetyltransferase